ncbi:MAG: hypothetical protein EOO08_11645 [Chitinophagaceae bacterium]|nr:MAG: hypothetical protein EOO08_11645 [Chitinophagaceae bacterium]
MASKFLNQAFLFAALSLSAVATPALAQPRTEKPAPEVQIIQVTPIDGRPTFQVRVDKSGTDALDLSIADDYGEVLFSETIRGDHYDRYFLVDIPANGTRLVLQLQSRKGRTVQKFDIDTEVRNNAALPVVSR